MSGKLPNPMSVGVSTTWCVCSILSFGFLGFGVVLFTLSPPAPLLRRRAPPLNYVFLPLVSHLPFGRSRSGGVDDTPPVP